MILEPSPSLEAEMHHFLNLARRHPPLDRREEQTLLARHRDGDPEAVDHLVNAHLRYVVDLAVMNEDRWRHVPLMDLFGEGATAVVAAIRTYDAQTHGPLRLHVVSTINRAMGAAAHAIRVRPEIELAGGGRRDGEQATAARAATAPRTAGQTPAPRLRSAPAPASGRHAATAASGWRAAGSP